MLSNDEVFVKVEAVINNATHLDPNIFKNHEVEVIVIEDCSSNQVGTYVAQRAKFDKNTIVICVFVQKEQNDEFFAIMNTIVHYRCVEDALEKSIKKENGRLFTFYPDIYLGEKIVKFSGQF